MAQIFPTAYINDAFVPFTEAKLSVASAPFLYGIAVYTVLMVRFDDDGRAFLFRLREHYDRLVQSARIMDFSDFSQAWSYEKFEKTIKELVQRNDVHEDALVRVTVYIDELMSGTRMHGLKNGVALFMYKHEPLLPLSGTHLCVSSWQRTPDAAIPARAKVNGNYANSALAKNEALINGYDDAILLDERGHVCESTVANLFMVRDGVLICPAEASSLLEGITRRTVLEVAKDLNIPTVQREVDRSELYIADEIFLSGSTARLTPVLSVDRRPVGSGKPGALTTQLTKKLDALTKGAQTDYVKWLTPLA